MANTNLNMEAARKAAESKVLRISVKPVKNWEPPTCEASIQSILTNLKNWNHISSGSVERNRDIRYRLQEIDEQISNLFNDMEEFELEQYHHDREESWDYARDYDD